MSSMEGGYRPGPDEGNPGAANPRLPENVTPERDGDKEIMGEDSHLGPPKVSDDDMQPRSPLESLPPDSVNSAEPPLESDVPPKKEDTLTDQATDKTDRDPFAKRDLLTQLDAPVEDFMRAIESRYASTDRELQVEFIRFLTDRVAMLRDDHNTPFQLRDDLDRTVAAITQVCDGTKSYRQKYLDELFGPANKAARGALQTLELSPAEPEDENKNLEIIDNVVREVRGAIGRREGESRADYHVIPQLLERLRADHPGDTSLSRLLDEVLDNFRKSIKIVDFENAKLADDLGSEAQQVGRLISEIRALES